MKNVYAAQQNKPNVAMEMELRLNVHKFGYKITVKYKTVSYSSILWISSKHIAETGIKRGS